MNRETVIETFGLTKYFGRACAVDQVSLAVPRGSVFAMLGRNGSGKSTLILMMLGLIEPTRGHAVVLGEHSNRLSPAVRGRIGFVGEGHPLPGFMRVRDLRSYQKSFYPTKWSDPLFRTLIEHFGLHEKSKAGQLSRGQKAGLAMALAMASGPELLIMDDPALGLDPVARRTLLEAMILSTRDRGNTIFFTSHELADVERVADHIAILDRSALRVCCSLDTLRSRVKRYLVSPRDAAVDLSALPGLLQARRLARETEVVAVSHPDTLPRLQSLAGGAVEEAPVTLEDIAIGYLSEQRSRVSLLAASHAEVA